MTRRDAPGERGRWPMMSPPEPRVGLGWWVGFGIILVVTTALTGLVVWGFTEIVLAIVHLSQTRH
jgi:hypothetical protein